MVTVSTVPIHLVNRKSHKRAFATDQTDPVREFVFEREKYSWKSPPRIYFITVRCLSTHDLVASSGVHTCQLPETRKAPAVDKSTSARVQKLPRASLISFKRLHSCLLLAFRLGSRRNICFRDSIFLALLRVTLKQSLRT